MTSPGPQQLTALRDSARRNLLGAGTVLGSGLALSALYATTGLGLPCPLRALTGWSCPLCGGTRMGTALLHLDLAAALAYHPLALAGLLLGALTSAAWLAQLLRGRAPRAYIAALRGIAAVPARMWWVAGILVVVGYTVVRNLVWPIPA